MKWGALAAVSKTIVALRPWRKGERGKTLARAYACFLVNLARKVFF